MPKQTTHAWIVKNIRIIAKKMRVFPIEDKQQPALRDFADLSFEGLEGPSATIIAESNYAKRATLRIAEGGIVMP